MGRALRTECVAIEAEDGDWLPVGHMGHAAVADTPLLGLHAAPSATSHNGMTGSAIARSWATLRF
jgi:hypothetical protein